MKLLYETIIVALAAIKANALRSILTALGIIIGISAVITMVALGEGAQRNVESQLDLLGANVLSVRPANSRFGGVSREGTLPLTLEDAEALRDQSEPGLMRVNPTSDSRRQVTWTRFNANLRIQGGWPDYFQIENHVVEMGRIYDQGEVQGRRRVAVLGSAIPGELNTEAAELLGETIQIGGQPFEVIGVLKEKGSIGPWVRPDESIYIPITTYVKSYGGRHGRTGWVASRWGPRRPNSWTKPRRRSTGFFGGSIGSARGTRPTSPSAHRPTSWRAGARRTRRSPISWPALRP